MAKHHPDLIFCRKQAGVAIGRLCDKKGFTIQKVEILLVSIKYWRHSFWRELKRITLISATDDVSFAILTFDRLLLCASVTSVITVPSRYVFLLQLLSCKVYKYSWLFQGRCVICGGPGISDAYYCRECTKLEKVSKDCFLLIWTRNIYCELF